MTTLFAPPRENASTFGYPSLVAGDSDGTPSRWGPPVRGVDITSADDAHFGGFAGNTAMLLMGRRGNGKTLLQTAISDQELIAWLRKRREDRLFSNYFMSFMRAKPNDEFTTLGDMRRHGLDVRAFGEYLNSDSIVDVYDPEIISRIAEFPQWFRRGSFRGDEAQTMAMGRRSMAGSNVNMSQFLTQMRHREIDTTFTTQFPQVIDYQVLLQIDVFAKVHVVKRRPYRPWFPYIIRVELWDWWGQITGKDWRKAWPPAREDIDDVRMFYIPERLMGTYDTNQIIASVYWSKNIRDSVGLEEELALQNVWLDKALVDADRDREDELAEAAEKAQDVYQEDPSVRFGGDIVDWAKRMGPEVNVNAVLVTAQIIDPSIQNALGLADVFKAIGYEIEVKKVGGAKTYLAVKR